VKFQDYYQTLGVARTATDDEIKRAYRKLAKEWHPDRHPPNKRADVETRFKAIAEAYDVLSDPEKRKRYDQLGEHWRHGQDFQPPPGGGFRTVSPEEFARMFGGGARGGGFSDFFSQMFGDLFQGAGRPSGDGRGARPARASRGVDAEAELELAVGDAMRGGKRHFELEVSTDCEACDGEGRVGRRVCPVCGGLGTVRSTRSVELAIPDDVHDGQRLRLRGLGERSEDGGATGDLVLRIRLVADDVYRLRGGDVEADLAVAPWEALDGARVDVPVRKGTASVKVPAGVQAGERLRLRSQGLAHADGTRGDLLLVIRFALPGELSERHRELLRELGRDAGRVIGGVRR
jgi:DnaJ-class molecular chaperone